LGKITFEAHGGMLKSTLTDLALEATEDGSATGGMRFLGKISFEAHGGMLNATLSDLGLEVTDDGLVLTVLDAPMNQDRCAIATLSLAEKKSEDSVTLNTEITVDGMYQIADNYPPGTELDPLQLE